MTEKALTDGSLALNKKRRVITIEATEPQENMKLRVAAYCRVSSSSEDQMNSFAAQTRYYTDLISANENWQMVDIYADAGITGTSAEKRTDFQRLLSDCKKGLIDKVLVKSVSRFARNTKECLEAVRELKGLGVNVCFEKENIDTAEMTGEMMTVLFASFAQAESESISGNMRWSYQKRMQNGTFLPASMPYGYEMVDREIRIVADEAKVVRRIFAEYLSGKNIVEIANGLNNHGQNRKSNAPGMRWHSSTIKYILTNEKYIGDSLWQKKYTTDTFPFQRTRNHGEQQMYYAKQTHPAIISEEQFQAAQLLMHRRRSESHNKSQNAFSQKIVCGACGTNFQWKIIREKNYWICLRHKNEGTCKMPMIPEKAIQSAFLRLYYNLKYHGISIFSEIVSQLQTIRSHRMLWIEDVVELNRQISDLSSQNQMLAELKQQGLIDPDIFICQFNEITGQLRKAKQKKECLLNREGNHTIQQTRDIIESLEYGPEFLDTFDKTIFGDLVEKIIVESNENIRFRLKNGLELPETIERTVR